MKRTSITAWKDSSHKSWNDKWNMFDKECYFDNVHQMLSVVKIEYKKAHDGRMPWLRIFSEPRMSTGYRTKLWFYHMNTKDLLQELEIYNSKYNLFNFEITKNSNQYNYSRCCMYSIIITPRAIEMFCK